MIPHGVEIFMSVAPIDLRWGFNRLAGVVAESIGRDARCGALFLFMGKRRDALKILFFDGTGLCLFYKRLDRGLFRSLPLESNGGTSVQVDESDLELLLDGIDLEPDAKPPMQGRGKAKRGNIIH